MSYNIMGNETLTLQFFEEFNSNSYKASIGLMIEAYDDLGDSSGSWCEPVDPKGSGNLVITQTPSL